MTFENLSDSALDNAFALSYDARDYQTAQLYGSEIIARSLSVGSFILSLGFYDAFPKYHARTNKVDAWSSVGVGVAALPETISTVGGAVTDAASNVGKSIFGGLFIAVALGVVAIYFIERK